MTRARVVVGGRLEEDFATLERVRMCLADFFYVQ